MPRIKVHFEADNRASAVFKSASNTSITITIDPQLKWDAEALAELAATISALSGVLKAAAETEGR
jgi:hypothetical protein